MEMGFLEAHTSNFTRGRSKKIDRIVIHYTAGDGDTAEDNCKYFREANRQASAHFFVDEGGVVQSVREGNTAWHADNWAMNCRSIGIELCSRKDEEGRYYIKEEVLRLAAVLTKELMNKYGIGLSGVIRHYDVTGKKCPAPMVEDPEIWDRFRAMLAPLQTPSPAPQPADNPKLQQYGAAFENIEHLAYIPAPKNGETVKAAAKRVTWNGRAPDAICNGEFYNMKTREPATGCPGYITQAMGFAFVDEKKPVLSWANNQKAKDWIAGHPLLLRDGKQAFEKTPAGLEGKRGRMALAISDTHFAFFYLREQNGATLEEFAAAILQRGFHTAINLDGGGSVACITPGVSYDQGRKVCGKIAMWIKGGTGNKETKK